MKPYSVIIDVPERYDMNKRPRPIYVRFETKEEKEEYVIKETRYTEKQLKDCAKAWSLYQREEAFVKLYHARKAFHDSIFKRQAPKSAA